MPRLTRSRRRTVRCKRMDQGCRRVRRPSRASRGSSSWTAGRPSTPSQRLCLRVGLSRWQGRAHGRIYSQLCRIPRTLLGVGRFGSGAKPAMASLSRRGLASAISSLLKMASVWRRAAYGWTASEQTCDMTSSGRSTAQMRSAQPRDSTRAAGTAAASRATRPAMRASTCTSTPSAKSC